MKLANKFLCTAILSACTSITSATVVVLGENGFDTVYMDTITARAGASTLLIKVDTADATHGTLAFENKENQNLINCNLVGNTFTANGFTCGYDASGYLNSLSPAPEVFVVKSSGTSNTLKVSFGIKGPQ